MSLHAAMSSKWEPSHLEGEGTRTRLKKLLKLVLLQKLMKRDIQEAHNLQGSQNLFLGLYSKLVGRRDFFGGASCK